MVDAQATPPAARVMDRIGFQDWLDRYVEAWKTYDADKIGALFSEDCVYRYSPEDDGEHGRAAIVEDWLSSRDEPGTYDGTYEPLAIGEGLHFARGTTSYFDAGGKLRDKYWNLFVCRFNEAGECTEFTEYWMQGRAFRRDQAGEG